MTGAMYAGVAGLKTHMGALNVIGNNVANVNTDAYKSKRYVFNEALYTSVHSGSDGTAVLGGRNPAQIGYGASIGSIDLDMSTKSYHPTGKLMDSMIDGDGFYIVGDKTHNMITEQDQLQGMNLTRRGDFQFVNGYLVDGNGQVVYGFLNTKIEDDAENAPEGATKNFTVPVLTPIRLPKMFKTMEGKNTVVNVVYPQWGGLTSADDADGSYLYTPETGVDIDKESPAFGTGDNRPTDNEFPTDDEELEWVVLENLSIEENGRIVGTTDDDKQVIVGYLALAKVDNPNGVTHVDGHYYQAMGGAGRVHLCSPGAAVQFVAGADGDDNGIPEGEPWDAVNDAMQLDIAQAGKTRFINGGLEMGGTDLADEISNMICIQRGYQANTRIVTVTDSMLEELVNMKR